jgi:hypothetical protein
MKTLNGQKYFEKIDVKGVIILALSVVDNPYDDQDFLLSILEDEKRVIRDAIKAFGNSITWEFASETAVNTKKLAEIEQSLRFLPNEILSYNDLKDIPVDNVSKLNLQCYENWLQHMGLTITMDEFVKISK